MLVSLKNSIFQDAQLHKIKQKYSKYVELPSEAKFFRADGLLGRPIYLSNNLRGRRSNYCLTMFVEICGDSEEMLYTEIKLDKNLML